ncbi:MAG TPA: hypothetical protein VNG29_02910 [Candidatus Paceibacterota bacterium]|nr:hypothetical protein [Candidatus Paceibacterota bacterium]
MTADIYPPQVIICDVGNVIVKWKPLHECDGFVASCAAGREAIKAFFNRSDGASGPLADYERGKIGNEEFFDLVRRALGYRHEYERFCAEFCDIFEFDPEMYRFVFNDLKAHPSLKEIWVFSDTNPLHYEYLHNRWPGIFSGARRIFLSFEVGHWKVDQEAWDAVHEATSLFPVNFCCLIDDMHENCEAAREYGFAAIRFEAIGQLRTILDMRGIKTGPAAA